MKTKAVRMYGKMDLRLDEFDLPDMGEDEILAHVISDSICLSSYKAAKQGNEHKRVPEDIADNPVMIGHEFCGEIVEVGKKWKDSFRAGQKFSIQPALNYKGTLDAPGYSYRYIGGDSTYIVIPNEVMRWAACSTTREMPTTWGPSRSRCRRLPVPSRRCITRHPEATSTRWESKREGIWLSSPAPAPWASAL